MNTCEYEEIPGFPFLNMNELEFEANIERNTSTSLPLPIKGWEGVCNKINISKPNLSRIIKKACRYV